MCGLVQAKDAARSAMGMPKWTVADSMQVRACMTVCVCRLNAGADMYCCVCMQNQRWCGHVLLCVTCCAPAVPVLCLQELEDVCKTAGFSSISILGEMHFFRANDKREKEVAEGLNPIQVSVSVRLKEREGLNKDLLR